MGKKRKKRENNFPRHIITGVAVTSLAFGVLTNASAFENLFEPQSYKNFEQMQKNKNSDYVSGKDKNTDLADKNKKKNQNTGKDLQQALKLNGNDTSDLNLSSNQNSNSTAKNSNTFSISDKDGQDTIGTTTGNTDQTDNGTGNENSSNNNTVSKDPSTPSSPVKPTDKDQNSDTTPVSWEDSQLLPRDLVATKYGKIKKLTATITKEEYYFGEKFNADDATVIGTFVKDGKTYTKELPYGGDDGYQVSFSSNKTGNLTAVFSYGGMTTRCHYKVSSNHVIINFFVLYNDEYYAAQFKGSVFDFLETDVQDYLTSLNKVPYTYPIGGNAIDLSNIHSRMIAYLGNEDAKTSIVKFDGNYKNVNFLEESSDGYLTSMLEGFRFTTTKKLIDSQSYIYYPADNDRWNYSINSKNIVDTIVVVPDEYKIKRETQSDDDWKTYCGDQVLEQYTGSEQNLCVPMGVTKIKLTEKPSNADITTLTLPESVDKLDFESISKYLPDLQEYAYSDPDDARSINFRDYKIVDGVLYSADGSTLLSVPAGRTKKLVIPSTVTTLAKGCLQNVSLDKIYFEDSNPPAVLGDTGYQGTIVVPESEYDNSVKQYMFAFQSECDKIDFISENESSALYDYDSKTNTICRRNDSKELCAISSDEQGLYTVDSKYETIDAGAFYKNTSLTDIEFGSNIKKLKNESLVFSDDIGSIIINGSNVEIEPYIFGDPSDGSKVPDIKIYVKDTDHDTYLKKWSDILDPVYGEGTTKKLLAVSDGNILYEDGAKYEKYQDGNSTKYRLLKVYDAKKTALKLKDGTAEIANGAFNKCKKLEILYLPSTIQSISKDMFDECSSLESVITMSPSLKTTLKKNTTAELFTIGSDYQDFVYENGVIYGKSLDGSYTLLNVPTDMTGVFIVKNNTKKLYEHALSECNFLEEVIIPDTNSLTEIAPSCFAQNQAIQSVDLSEMKNLQLLGTQAFKDCTNLEEVKLPDQLETLEDQTFYGCSNLTTVDGNGIKTIKDEVFSECILLDTLHGFDDVQTLGASAFYDCQSLTNMILGTSISKIDEECFENCINLRSITINGTITGISRYCFSGCEKLVDVSISKQQKSCLRFIGVEAFAECNNLKNLNFSDASSLKNIGEGAFVDCTELVSVKFPKSVTSLPDNCFSGCNSLSTLQLKSEQAVTLGNSVFGKTISNYLHILVPEKSLDDYRSSYKKTLDKTYGNGTTNKVLGIIDPKIEYLKGVKYELTSEGRVLKEVTDDFSGELTVLEDTVRIEKDTFKNCSKLTKLVIPEGCKLELGDRCFKDCKNLTKIELYGDIPQWGDEVFMGCTSLSSITIGYSTSEIPRIGTRAFKDCTGLSDVSAINIAAHVNTIGKEAFMNCTNLPAIGFTINDANGDARTYLQEIEDYAFSNCQSLTTLLTTNFSGIQKLGNYAFKGCSSLKQPSLAKSLTSVGKGCFMDCSNLLYVSFYGAVEEFPEDCFRNCPKLIRTGGTDLAFQSLKRIGDHAYAGCSSLATSTSWYLERYANLEEIGDYAFENCTTLADSALSSTITKIGAHAFDGCSAIGTLTFNGTQPPTFGTFLPETMSEDFMIKVPDSKDEDDVVYKAYYKQLKLALSSDDIVYKILDSVSDEAKDRNAPSQANDTTTEEKINHNEETKDDH